MVFLSKADKVVSVYIAAEKGKRKVVEYLVANGASPSMVGDRAHPLSVACTQGHVRPTFHAKKVTKTDLRSSWTWSHF